MSLNSHRTQAIAKRTFSCFPSHSNRSGAIIILAAAFLIIVFALTAFTVDVGYMLIVKSELQTAADAAALAGVQDLSEGAENVQLTSQSIAMKNSAGGNPVALATQDIELGTFNLQTRAFEPGVTAPNSVRVTSRVAKQPFFFAPVLGQQHFDLAKTAIAMINPRDIVFVVDLSGSMDDDTEPIWATPLINARLTPQGYPDTALQMIQAVYDDFGFGTYPGEMQYIGEPLGVQQSEFAYAELTRDDGPLTCDSIPAFYRIANDDDEETRRLKCYRWIIDYQIAVVMPNAIPAPNAALNYDYWQRYIDYIIEHKVVGDAPADTGGGGDWGGGGGGPEPPSPPAGLIRNVEPKSSGASRSAKSSSGRMQNHPQSMSKAPEAGAVGYVGSTSCSSSFNGGLPRRGSRGLVNLPPSTRVNNMYSYNNPNFFTFPEADWSYIWNNTNRISYKTYVQFMMDFGRENTEWLSDFGAASTPLSIRNPLCPKHSEATAGGTFQFPPREQPMHAVRRSLIAAINYVKTQNASVPGPVGDWVSIVVFDSVDESHSPQILQPLTSDFAAAMRSCTHMQSVWDNGCTTATEYGLKVARDHLKAPSFGGSGRQFASKVIVLLSDGVPNVWFSSAGAVATENGANPSPEYYGADYIWYNAPLMQTSQFQRLDKGRLFAVGMGVGADINYMDRLARMAKTDVNGLSPRGAANPADYEQRLTEIFTEIIKSPGGRLVK